MPVKQLIKRRKTCSSPCRIQIWNGPGLKQMSAGLLIVERDGTYIF